MAGPRNLSLHEEAMLLALSEEKGTIELGAWYHQAVGAAVLAELLLSGHLRTEGPEKKKLVLPTVDAPPGTTDPVDPLLAEWLERIRSEKKPKALCRWASKVANTKDLKERVARGLAEKGILEVQEDRVLFVVKRALYPERDPGPEQEIRARLHDAIFTDAQDLDPRTVVLVSLARSTGLLNIAFGKKSVKAREERILRVVNGETIGAAAKELVEAIQAAILVVCVLPAAIR